MVKLITPPLPPSSQQGLEARLEGVQAEIDCLLDAVDGPKARSYLLSASQAVWKATTLARQGL